MAIRRLIEEVSATLYEEVDNDAKRFRFEEEVRQEAHRKLHYLKLHMREANDKNDEKEEMMIHGCYALAYIKLHDYEQAKVHLNIQLKMSDELRDNTAKRQAHGNLGVIAKRAYDLHTAQHHFQESLDVAMKQGNVYAQARLYNNMANIMEMTAQYERAIEYQRMRLGISEQVGDLDGMAKALGSLGGLYHTKEDLHNSIRFYKELTDLLRNKLKVFDVLADDASGSDGDPSIELEDESDGENEEGVKGGKKGGRFSAIKKRFPLSRKKK